MRMDIKQTNKYFFSLKIDECMYSANGKWNCRKKIIKIANGNIVL